MKELSHEAMDRGIEALRHMRRVADAHKASIFAVATSAVREAQNSKTFVDRAAIEAGIEIEVISGVEEARLIHLGVLQALPLSNKRSLLIDIGGGSTEVVIFDHTEELFVRSFKLGAVRLSNRFFPHENAPNGKTALLAQFDRTIDPEDEAAPVTNRSDIDIVADFQRLLAPPAPLPFTAKALAGQKVFGDIGCALCHVPQLTTGPSAIAALRNKPVNLYSDLLLHDMGPLGDGIAQSAASAKEMRTTPLWGLRLRRTYLHDGRAQNIDAAVRGHDGQGKASRDRYSKLNAADSAALIEFLGSL